MQKKTTRAFRTISEAGEELDLQPHVLRFWESKFSQIKPIKRGGGRRFYRAEDIEFLRGIKILLHNEKHPIKDVQKLIRMKGPQRVIELGQSVERAAKNKDVTETVLVPKRIMDAQTTQSKDTILAKNTARVSDKVLPKVHAKAGETAQDNNVQSAHKTDEMPRSEDKLSEGKKTGAANRIVPFIPKSSRKPFFHPFTRDEHISNVPADADVSVEFVKSEALQDNISEVQTSNLSETSLRDVGHLKSKAELQDALARLKVLRSQWVSFKESLEHS